MPRMKRDALVLRTDPDTHAQIAARAKRHGVTMAEEVRTLLEWALEDHPLDGDDPLARVSSEIHNTIGG